MKSMGTKKTKKQTQAKKELNRKKAALNKTKNAKQNNNEAKKKRNDTLTRKSGRVDKIESMSDDAANQPTMPKVTEKEVKTNSKKSGVTNKRRAVKEALHKSEKTNGEQRQSK